MARAKTGSVESGQDLNTQTAPLKTLTSEERKPRERSSLLVPLLLASLGILLRLIQFLHHRSLWFDEALLALNLLNRSYSSLIRPLDYDQGAPVGFLFLERFVGMHLGFGESALRLIPFLVSIGALYLFYKFAQCTLSPSALWISIGLIAVCPHLIYYASEVKQ